MQQKTERAWGTVGDSQVMLSAKNGRSQKLLLPPILQGDPDDLRDLRDLLPAGLPPGQQQKCWSYRLFTLFTRFEVKVSDVFAHLRTSDRDLACTFSSASSSGVTFSGSRTAWELASQEDYKQRHEAHVIPAMVLTKTSYRRKFRSETSDNMDS
jgi:hypothetical protein